MDEDILRQLLTAQENGVEFAPTADMMMMNSATMNDDEGFDPALVAMMQQHQQAVRVNQQAMSSRNIDTDDDLLLEDETILERIVALKEMFPESVQKAFGTLNSTVVNTSKFALNKGRTAAWWATSTMCVLVFPILIQKELLQVAEQISREQRSILLGPQAATGAFSGGGAF